MKHLGLWLALVAGPAAADDLADLKDWYAGAFDNEAQVARETVRDPHVHIHAVHHRFDSSVFGDAFYVEEYRDGDPDDVIRQRLVTFSWDESRRAIRMKQGFLPQAQALRGAHLMPAKLDGLGQDDVVYIDGCDVFWRRLDDVYVAQMDDRACVVGSGEDERWVYYRLWLTPDRYLRVDTSFRTSDGTMHGGFDITRPYEHHRVEG